MNGEAVKGRRTRLSRTVSLARWREYRRFVEDALGAGYDVIGLEDWVDRGCPREGRVLILRHDVDQHPGSALKMLDIERRLGVRSTWYFRWRTAHPAVVGAVRESAAGVGLHYETLTRACLARRRPDAAAMARLAEECRDVLRAELRAFASAFGPARSACPHGDSRVPGVRNSDLLRDCDCEPFGIEFDGNEVMRGKRIGFWLTDRSGPDGGWGDAVRPTELFDAGISPILCVVHPNNWASGASLWRDRVLGGILPSAGPDPQRRESWPVVTTRDAPPIDHG